MSHLLPSESEFMSIGSIQTVIYRNLICEELSTGFFIDRLEIGVLTMISQIFYCWGMVGGRGLIFSRRLGLLIPALNRWKNAVYKYAI